MEVLRILLLLYCVADHVFILFLRPVVYIFINMLSNVCYPIKIWIINGKFEVAQLNNNHGIIAVRKPILIYTRGNGSRDLKENCVLHNLKF